MKSPRDILLKRHRRQEPALDRIREQVVAQELGADTAAVHQGRTGFQEPVHERTEKAAHVRAQTAQLALASISVEAGCTSSEISPATGVSPAPAKDRLQACPTFLARWFTWLNWQRAAWSGFAAVWCVILGLNLSAGLERESPVASGSRAEAREVLEGMRAYRAQLAALLTDQSSRTGSGAQVQPPILRPRSDADRIRKDALHFNTAFA